MITRKELHNSNLSVKDTYFEWEINGGPMRKEDFEIGMRLLFIQYRQSTNGAVPELCHAHINVPGYFGPSGADEVNIEGVHVVYNPVLRQNLIHIGQMEVKLPDQAER